MTPPVSRRHIVSWAIVLMLTLFAGVSVAGARGTTPAASLQVTVPASMASGSVLTVRARGYSGKYNAVSWSSVQRGGSACAAPTAGTIGMQAVARRHTFNVKFTNIFGAPGTMTVCVYLFTSGAHANTKGHYLVKSKRVKVS
jgi:hypothetical protein